LISVRAALTLLESSDVRVMDCRNLGLSAAEPLAKVRKLADDWKQPFQKEYTERSVSQAFEKLLGLRADVDAALAKVAAKNNDRLIMEYGSGGNAEEPSETPRKPIAAALAKKNDQPAGASEQKTPAASPLDFEYCMEKIWEQLIATPPLRGRSMTTVSVGDTKILLSSWEVAAFVNETGPAAEDLRRAVSARAMVTSATTLGREKNHKFALDKAMAVGRVEVSRLQERVDMAKQVKDTEAAVNLGISTKRLLSALDEAEKI
jgi:hypothetical protein